MGRDFFEGQKRQKRHKGHKGSRYQQEAESSLLSLISLMSLLSLIINNQLIMYRYQLEKYRGRNTRHTCPRCGRKGVFTRYIDTENNNIYNITDNPWKRECVCSFIHFHRKNERMNKNKPPFPYNNRLPENRATYY